LDILSEIEFVENASDLVNSQVILSTTLFMNIDEKIRCIVGSGQIMFPNTPILMNMRLIIIN
jgi:hypothetical protein